jgi:hypothetical protein
VLLLREDYCVNVAEDLDLVIDADGTADDEYRTGPVDRPAELLPAPPEKNARQSPLHHWAQTSRARTAGSADLG